MDDALTRAIEGRFALEIHAAKQIEQGDEALVWRADTDRGPIVAHVGPAWRSSEELVWVHRVVQHAAARVPQSIAPRRAGDGSTFFRHEGRPVTLFAFVEGEPLDPTLPAPRAHSARVLASLHAAMAGWAGGPRPAGVPGGPGRRGRGEDRPELVDRELDRWWAATSPSLRAGVLHGDYYRRNLLCRRGKVVAVIDWHEAHVGPIASEVAWAAWEMAHDDELRFLPERAASFLGAYGPGAPSLALAVPLIRVWLRENIRYALRLASYEQPIEEGYLATQLRAFVDLGLHTP